MSKELENLKKEYSKTLIYYRGIVEGDTTPTIAGIAKLLDIRKDLAVDLWLLCNVIKFGRKEKIMYQLPD